MIPVPFIGVKTFSYSFQNGVQYNFLKHEDIICRYGWSNCRFYTIKRKNSPDYERYINELDKIPDIFLNARR